jgi:branched-chain amino acid transport system permease protein
MFAGVGVAVLLAFFIGYISFRLEMPLLAFTIFTLALVNIALFVVDALPAIGGSEGLNIIFFEDNPAQFQWVSKIPYYYIMLGALIIMVLIMQYILKSKMGYYLKALHQNPRASRAAGVDPLKYHTLALVISAIPWAFAGTFWAQYAGFVDPHTLVSVHIMIAVIILVGVGGMGTAWGPVIIPFFLVLMTEYLRGEIGGKIPGIAAIIYGVAIVAVLLGLRTGVFVWLERRHRARELKRRVEAGSSTSSG